MKIHMDPDRVKKLEEIARKQGGSVSIDQVFERDTSIRPSSGPYANICSGKAPDLSHATRSLLETNGSRVLNKMIDTRFRLRHVGRLLIYIYEPIRLWFPLETKTNSYTPDGLLIGTTGIRFVEFKGRLVKASFTKIRRFYQYYPAEFRQTLWLFDNQDAAKKLRILYKGSSGDLDIQFSKDWRKDWAGMVNWQTKKEWQLEQRLKGEL